MLIDDIKKFNIILASNSPRRKELIDKLGISFTIAEGIGGDESYPSNIAIEDAPKYISKQKSDRCNIELKDNDILITADTLVIIDDTVLGKPKDRAEAILMLKKLSGRVHKVITAVTIKGSKHIQAFSETTEVTFRPLKEDEIEYYVDNYKPYDKAGAYAIQEWIGIMGVEGIKGSYYNIMGLPTDTLYRQLNLFIKK